MSIDFTGYSALFSERSFLVTFLAFLFTESKKRRIGEGADGLALEAAKRTVDMLMLDIVVFQQRAHGGRVYWTADDYDALAAEAVRFGKRSKRYKQAVTGLLREYRSELFEVEKFRIAIDDCYNVNLKTVLYDEHPMQTFNKALDLIEFQKSTDRETFLLKLNLTNLARVGHAMLDRSEWEGELFSVAPQIESEERCEREH